MFDALLTLFSSPNLLGAMLAAVPIGLVFGIVPGLGGKIAIIAMLPFVFAMDMLTGCVFLIALHAVVHTGGAVPAILFGIPGTGPSTAIVMDGHAMAQRGEAARALSASAISSAIGGLLGAVFLAALIPISLGLMRLISYPEVVFLAVFGIAIAALLSGDALAKGLATGCLGLALALVGADAVYGVDRFTFGQPFLWDGFDLIAAVLAIYAIPEMIALAKKQEQARTYVAASGQPDRSGWREGANDVLAYRWLTLRSSGIGAIVGFIPGLGGDVAAWLCYGHAVQSSKHPERFGQGEVAGVIGPEAANNSKEGGALAPTLFLGLPGSSGMAILLVALIPLGVAPGPDLPARHPELLWLMVWTLALSNVLGAAILLAFSKRLQSVTKLDRRIVVPVVYLLALVSIYLSASEWRFLVMVGGLGLLGYAFKCQRWPRAPFVIGLILGPAAETALIKSLEIWGPTFFMRPVSIGLLILMLIGFTSLSRKLFTRTQTLGKAAKDAR